MKPESSIRGFRVPVLFEGDTDCKYLIFINYNLCRFVKDVINHLKEIFHLDYDIYLTVEDCILPENEVIHVLFCDDDLKICRKKGPDEKSDEKRESSEVTKLTNHQRKGVKRKPVIDNGIGDCLKMLLGKKSELQKKLEKSPENVLGECSVVKVSHDEASNLSTVESKTSNEIDEGKHDESQESNFDFSESGKRKRKRKRTKKTPSNDISYTSETSSIVSDNTVTELTVSLQNENANKNHIYFNEDEIEVNNATAEVNVETNNDDWKSNLLNLASEPQESKVFERSSQ